MDITLKILAGVVGYFAFPVGFALLFMDSYKGFWDEFVDALKFWFILTTVSAVFMGSFYFIFA
ncbi:hypothetical protein [Priestia megaterium]|uniref:hypothetical protein n=1 Tax=Priestia megaterium TaxID=1404 RepID=UPI00196B7039|nr:hypothetical protein [Priestia megaterium]QSF38454.1 hypothetical protein ICR96_23910 [Priestia megaterium]